MALGIVGTADIGVGAQASRKETASRALVLTSCGASVHLREHDKDTFNGRVRVWNGRQMGQQREMQSSKRSDETKQTEPWQPPHTEPLSRARVQAAPRSSVAIQRSIPLLNSPLTFMLVL
jgi:hypothetical protein